MSGWPEAGPRHDPASGLNLRLMSVTAGAAGLACVVAGLHTGLWGGVFLGGGLWGIAVFFHLVHFVRPRADKRVRQELGPDGVRVQVGLRPQRPLSALCAPFSVAMMLAASWFLELSILLQVPLLTLQVAALVLVPDAVRGLLASDRGVILTARTLTYRGWSYDVEVPWEEVLLVGIDASNPYLPCIRIDLVTKGSIRSSRHRVIVALEPSPQPDHVKIPTVALDRPMQLIGLARHLVDLPAQYRHEYLAAHGLSVLTR